MEMTVIWIEFGLFVVILGVISWQFFKANKRLRKISMTQDEVLAKVAALDTKVDALIAKAGTPVDLAPLGAAVDAIAAKVDAANPPV